MSFKTNLYPTYAPSDQFEDIPAKKRCKIDVPKNSKNDTKKPHRNIIWSSFPPSNTPYQNAQLNTEKTLHEVAEMLRQFQITE